MDMKHFGAAVLALAAIVGAVGTFVTLVHGLRHGFPWAWMGLCGVVALLLIVIGVGMAD